MTTPSPDPERRDAATSPSADANAAAQGTAGAVRVLDTDGFAQTIPGHPFAIIDFWAPWCAPCRAFAPTFESAAQRHPDILFAKVDTEEQQSLAAHFGIRSIPTLMIFRDNVIVYSQPGALSSGGLEQLIEAARGLDMQKVRNEVEAAHSEASVGAAAPSSGTPAGGASEY